MSKIDDAIRRVEESRQSHVTWAEHMGNCDFCRKNPPEFIQTRDEHLKIIEEYDNVLDCLAYLKRRADKYSDE